MKDGVDGVDEFGPLNIKDGIKILKCPISLFGRSSSLLSTKVERGDSIQA